MITQASLIKASLVLVMLLFLTFPLKAKTETLLINNHRLEVELALTPEKQKKGLMFKKKLQKNKGMLFIFDKESYIPIWMKNTYIPLDILWISSQNIIVDTKQNASPLSKKIYHPKQKANKVLEINAGLLKKWAIKKGTKVKIESN